MTKQNFMKKFLFIKKLFLPTTFFNNSKNLFLGVNSTAGYTTTEQPSSIPQQQPPQRPPLPPQQPPINNGIQKTEAETLSHLVGNFGIPSTTTTSGFAPSFTQANNSSNPFGG